MKRRISATVAAVITMLSLIAVNASACRAGPLNDGGAADVYTDGGEIHQYILTDYDIEFTNGERYSLCPGGGKCCSGSTPIDNEFIPVEGKNMITVTFCGITKDFEINCSYNADDFVERSWKNDVASVTGTLFRNIMVGTDVMTGKSALGSSKPLLGIRIIIRSFELALNSDRNI